MKNTSLIVLLMLLIRTNFANAEYTIKAVDEDGKIQLSDGKIVEFSGLYIPPEIKNKTVEYIKKNVTGKAVDIVLGGSESTAYNSYLIKNVKISEYNLILNLLKAGFAVNYHMEKPDIIDNDKKLAENEAIKTKSGLWSDSSNIFISKEELEQNTKIHLYNFRVVTGQVTATKLVKDKMYLNFGDDWKTDFTVIINKENLKNFGEADLDKLSGKKVMVRGWIEFYNGAAMEIYNASHLDVM